MRNRGLRLSLIVLFIAVLADALLTAFLLISYPERALGRDDFYSEELKDYSLGDEGLLTTLSDDPWMSHTFGEPLNIYSVRIRVSELSGPAPRRAQVYLLPGLSVIDTELSENVEAVFGPGSAGKDVGTLRLDLGSVEGISFRLENVLVNSRRDLVLFSQMTALRVALILGLMWAFGVSAKNIMLMSKSRRFALPLLGAVLISEALTAWLVRDASYPALLLVFGLTVFTALMLSLKKTFFTGYILLIPLSLMIFGLSETMSTYPFDFADKTCLVLGLLISYIIPALIYTALRRLAPAVTISALALGILSIANYYYSVIRAAPLEYFDLSLLGTALNVIDNYSLPLNRLSVSSLIAIADVSVVSFYISGLKRADSAGIIKYILSLAAAAALAAGLIYIVPTGYMPTLLIASREEGYFLHFISLMKMGHIDKPEGYTSERAGEILSGFETSREEGAKTPDIIVIMDESFADLPDIYDFATDEDVLPYYHSLRDETVWGYLLTSAYGGGTVMTEYEFLTGNSLYFFPQGTSPFVQYLTGYRQSLASRLSRLGYEAIAYHPYLKSSYNRARGYDFLGFQSFYSIEDELPSNETIRDYLSDSSDVANLIYLYENRDKDKPFFIFNVTMQNHGGYYTSGLDGKLIEPEREDLKDDELIGYLYLIHETDKALRELTEYFENVDNDVVILFFGDHQPTESADMGNAGDERFASGELRNYSSFMIWANFDIEPEAALVTSPNYLRAILLKTAGADLNPYEEFLLGAYHEMPSISSSGHTDNDNVWYYRGEDDNPLLDRYRDLVYANAFDREFISGSERAAYFE